MPLTFPEIDASSLTGFAGSRIDRLSERRTDPAYLAAEIGREDALFILFAEDRPVLARTSGELAVRHPRRAAGTLGARQDEAVLLGHENGIPLLAAWLEEGAGGAALDDDGSEDGTVTLADLRGLATRNAVDAHDLGLLALARSMTHWHQRHRFCANCGAPTTMALGGYRRDCAACAAHHFPRTDPVVIMLAIDVARDRCLLGRQYRFAPGMYSCLAGFVEPGETIEDAVRREILEEAGITIGKVAYLASQPWPFPSSLMIGCFAEARDFDLVRDAEELEDVRWVPRSELAAMLERRHADGLMAPPPMAIAHHIIRRYAEEGAR